MRLIRSRSMPGAPLWSEPPRRTTPPACIRFCVRKGTSRSFTRWQRRSAGSSRSSPLHFDPPLELLLFLRPFVGLLQILAGFFKRTKRVVVSLQRLTIFIDGSLALAGDIENLSQLQPAPDFRPARVAIAVRSEEHTSELQSQFHLVC